MYISRRGLEMYQTLESWPTSEKWPVRLDSNLLRLPLQNGITNRP